MSYQDKYQYNTKEQEKIEGRVLCYKPYPPEWRKKKTSPLTIALAVILVALLIFSAIVIMADAEGAEPKAYVLAAGYVNIRMEASKGSKQIGFLDPCEEIETDGEMKDGWVHIVAPVDGWVYAGYVTFRKPEAVGRSAYVTAKKQVARRKWIDGPKVETRPWLKNGEEVQVLFMSEDWAVTTRGYLRSEWLEVEGQ